MYLTVYLRDAFEKSGKGADVYVLFRDCISVLVHYKGSSLTMSEFELLVNREGCYDVLRKFVKDGYVTISGNVINCDGIEKLEKKAIDYVTNKYPSIVTVF